MGYTRKKKYKQKQLKKQYKTQKKNIKQAGGSIIPIFIICWNQYTYLKSMVEQLQKYDINMKIFIVDNKSTYEPLLKYLKEVDGKNGVKVLYQSENYGHKVYERPEFIAMAGEKYVVTDPDLLLNPNMPKNFLDILSQLSDKYKTNKIGFALDITNNIDLTKKFNGLTLPELERKLGAWDRPLNPRDPEYELYTASIDTTFALINSKYRMIGDLTNSIRVAGNFTAVHRPWTIGFEKDLLPGELDYYLKNKDNKSTTLNQWKTVQSGGKNTIGKIKNQPNHQKYIFMNLLKGEGLGNQLYIFAAALVVKNRTGLPISAIPSQGNPHSTKNYTNIFNTKRTTNLNISPERINLALDVLPPSVYSSFIQKWNSKNIKYNNNKNLKLPNTLFQNYESIKSVIPEIKEILTRTEFSKDAYKKYNSMIISAQTAFMHVRRGDYKPDKMLSIEFFMKGLDQLEKSSTIKTIYVFSNGIDWCKEHDADWKKHTTKQIVYDETKDELEVLYMMSLCIAGAIVSNSTFSSWGAILGADMNPNSIIVYSLKYQNIEENKLNPYDFPSRWIGI